MEQGVLQQLVMCAEYQSSSAMMEDRLVMFKFFLAETRAFAKRSSNVILESNSMIVTQAIGRDNEPPRLISNLIVDIITLAKTVEDIKFVYCSRFANELTAMIIKHMRFCCT